MPQFQTQKQAHLFQNMIRNTFIKNLKNKTFKVAAETNTKNNYS